LGDPVEAQLLSVGNEIIDSFTPELWVADYAALAYLVLPDLELRLDEGDDLAIVSEKRMRGRKEFFEADERRIDDDQVERLRESLSLQVPGVGALHDDDSLVLPKLVVQLPVAHVDREHFGRSALKQAVGEAASRGAEVGNRLASGVVLKRVERACELDPASRHIGVVGFPHLEGNFLVERFTALFDALASRKNLASEDQRLRSGLRWSEASLGQQHVGSDLRHVGRLD